MENIIAVKIILAFIAATLISIGLAFEIYDLYFKPVHKEENKPEIDYSYLDDPDYYGD